MQLTLFILFIEIWIERIFIIGIVNRLADNI